MRPCAVPAVSTMASAAARATTMRPFLIGPQGIRRTENPISSLQQIATKIKVFVEAPLQADSYGGTALRWDQYEV